MGGVSAVCNPSNGGTIPGSLVKARVWRTGTSTKYPEAAVLPEIFENTVDVGLALSGGGIRAACTSVGVLMALQELGLLSLVRYSSSNSGSSWLNAPFAFLPEKFDVAKFVGPVRGPAALTPQAIEGPEKGSFLHTAGTAKATRKLIVGLLIPEPCTCCGSQILNAWNTTVTKAYLADFDLASDGGVMAPPKGTEAHRVADEALRRTKAFTYPMRKGAPFPIINASKQLPVDDQTLPEWYGVEFTPLYGGVPALISDAPGGSVGGGVVENFGLGGPAPKSLPGGRSAVESGEVLEQKPTKFLPLAFAPGTSSAEPYTRKFEVGMRNFFIDSPLQQVALGGAIKPIWSPADIKSGNNGTGLIADGGVTDNSGVIALLRRGVTRAIISIAASASPAADGYIEGQWWPSLFGQAKEESTKDYAMNAEQLNRRAKVFEAAAFTSLWKELQAKAKAKEPVVAEVTLKVLRNDLAGVMGGYSVRTIWMLPILATSFESQLPAATQALIHRPRKSTKPRQVDGHKVGPVLGFALDDGFPFVQSWIGDYSQGLCTMLAENAAYNLKVGAGEKKLRDFFKF